MNARFLYIGGLVTIAIGVAMLAMRDQYNWAEYLSIPLIVTGTILVAKSRE